jgi:predicted ATPase/DNA-binding CsgD family transcriptional regulator
MPKLSHPELLSPLTEREVDILRLINEGLTNPEIAQALFLTTDTVKWYTKQIFSKLGVHNRAKAMVRTKELGLLDLQRSTVAAPKTTARHNLPPPSTSFVGREQEIAQVVAQLSNSDCRLLTIVGAGGMGKTRLAIEVNTWLLDAMRDGVYFVALQPISSPNLIVPAIAEALHFHFYPGIEPKQQLLDYLREKALLLALDNFEHLLDGTPLVSELLAYAPSLKVLATSREALNLQEEWVYPLKGMPFPQTIGERAIDQWSAVQLFTQSAHRMRADFTLGDEEAGVIRICQLVEGMPLGLELAAAWVRALSCVDIAAELERGLDILTTSTRNVPPRHRSIRAVLDHSWTLLTEAERAVFTALSMFRGGFRKEAARSVAGASLPMLSALVDKSLLRLSTNGRYDIHELLRQYGEEHLNATPDRREAMRDRHSAFYADFLHRQTERLWGFEHKEAMSDIEAEIDNVRAAWHWMVKKRKAAELRRASLSLEYFLSTRNRPQEGMDLFRQAVEALRPASLDREVGIVYGLVLALMGGFVQDLTTAQAVKASAEESLAIMQRFDSDEGKMHALFLLCYALGELQHIDAWIDTQQEGLRLAEASHNRRWKAIFLYVGAEIAQHHHDWGQAVDLLNQSMGIAERLGDPRLIAIFCWRLGLLELQQRHYGEAQWHLERGLNVYQEIDYLWGIAVSYGGLAEVAAALNDFGEARRYFRQKLELDLDVGLASWLIYTILHIALMHHHQGEMEQAIELLALIHQHPATTVTNYHLAAKRLVELQTEVPPDVFAAASQRGRGRDLETTGRELIAVFSQPY